MNEECLICKAPLEYLETDTMMECVICHKKENSKTRCVNGHFVCSECHTSGMDEIIALCLNEKSKNPIVILEKMMSMDFCHMHGPEHHVMVGSALLTAYKNAGGEIDLEKEGLELVKVFPVTDDYEEKVGGAKKRLTNALEIIVTAHYASVLKLHTDKKLNELCG